MQLGTSSSSIGQCELETTQVQSTVSQPKSAASKLDEELESRRRLMQRTIQKKVAELRAQGADDSVVKSAVNKIKKAEQLKVTKMQQNYERAEKGAKHEVVIIPVEWRRHEQETKTVDEVATAVKQALMSSGLNAWLDGRRQYTPGQKFAYWEHLGVKHRVEVGPEDIKKGTCRIVRADKPGAYLEHQRVEAALNAQAILRALGVFGLSVDVDIDRVSSDSLIPSEEAVMEPQVEAGDWAGNVAIAPYNAPRERKQSMFGPKRGFQGRGGFSRGGRGGRGGFSKPY